MANRQTSLHRNSNGRQVLVEIKANGCGRTAVRIYSNSAQEPEHCVAVHIACCVSLPLHCIVLLTVLFAVACIVLPCPVLSCIVLYCAPRLCTDKKFLRASCASARAAQVCGASRTPETPLTRDTGDSDSSDSRDAGDS